jgi:hypothetical protein
MAHHLRRCRALLGLRLALTGQHRARCALPHPRIAHAHMGDALRGAVGDGAVGAALQPGIARVDGLLVLARFAPGHAAAVNMLGLPIELAGVLRNQDGA